MLDDNHDIRINPKRKDGLIVSGFELGDIANQNQDLIILAEKGEFKEAPVKGVGIRSFIDDENPDGMLRAIRTELREDGMTVRRVGIENGTIVIDAQY